MFREYVKDLKFYLGHDPKIEITKNLRKYVPLPYKSVLLISADFELAWAWRYTKSAKNPLEKALQEARQERENLPHLVSLFEKYHIPVTWLTVGHLFLESCTTDNTLVHSNLPRLGNFQSEYWNFNGKDWFEHDPISDYISAPEWYCPDLIRLILNSKVKHEIGCHTFSHIDCSDKICSSEVFNAEIEECIKIANEWGIGLKSFVHPAHTIGNLDSLANNGFTNFRSDYNNVLGYPKRHHNGLWEIKQTTEFRYYPNLSINDHINKYRTIINRAIKSNTVASIWFHPSINPVFLTRIFPEILLYIQDHKDLIWVSTHGDYADFINEGIENG